MDEYPKIQFPGRLYFLLEFMGIGSQGTETDSMRFSYDLDD